MWNRRPILRCKTKEPAFCVRFSPDDQLVVAGHYDGTLVAYDWISSHVKFEVNVTPADQRIKVPITSVAFRPGGGKPLVLVGCSNGSVERWDVRTYDRVSSVQEEKNEIYAVDYRFDGHVFATAGRDATVRIYDDTTGAVMRSFSTQPEHSANVAATRIYSIKFHPMDPNVIVAGGWSNTLHVFDLRMSSGVKEEVFGPYLSGDALSISGSTVMTASARTENILQTFDLGTMQKADVKWPVPDEFLPQCLKISNDPLGDFVALGGGGGHGLKEMGLLMERGTNKVVFSSTFEKGVNSCAFCSKDPTVAFADGVGQVHVFEARRKP